MKKIILTSALVLGGMITYAQSTMKFTSFLANNTGKTITTESIMAEPKVAASPTPSTVSSFKISILPAKKDLIGPYTIKGNMLTQRELDAIKTLKAGDKIYIEDVKVTSGKEYAASSVVYTVK